METKNNNNSNTNEKRQIEDTLLTTNMMQNQQIPESLLNTVYTPAFLRKHLGKLVKVEFLIGTERLEDRTGILLEVGASYIVLRSVQDNNILYCDIYSIKFVTISTQSFIYGMDFQLPQNQTFTQPMNPMNHINNSTFTPGQISTSSFM